MHVSLPTWFWEKIQEMPGAVFEYTSRCTGFAIDELWRVQVRSDKPVPLNHGAKISWNGTNIRVHSCWPLSSQPHKSLKRA